MTTHLDVCASNLCADDDEKMRQVRGWFPDEAVCTKLPLVNWQKNQRKIKRYFEKGLLKYGSDLYFTGKDLSEMQRVSPAVRGRHPNYARRAI